MATGTRSRAGGDDAGVVAARITRTKVTSIDRDVATVAGVTVAHYYAAIEPSVPGLSVNGFRAEVITGTIVEGVETFFQLGSPIGAFFAISYVFSVFL